MIYIFVCLSLSFRSPLHICFSAIVIIILYVCVLPWTCECLCLSICPFIILLPLYFTLTHSISLSLSIYIYIYIYIYIWIFLINYLTNQTCKSLLVKQGRAHKWCTPMGPHIWPSKSRTTSSNIHPAAMWGYGMWPWRPARGEERKGEVAREGQRHLC